MIIYIYLWRRVIFLYPVFVAFNIGQACHSPEGGLKNPNGGAVMRAKITISCTECKQRNYNTMKNKKNTPDRLEMNKYCRFCKKHTLHKETK